LDFLVRDKRITPVIAAMLREFKKRWGLSEYYAVLQCSVLSESELADAIASGMGIDRVFHPATLPIENEALDLIPFRKARALECLPVHIVEEGIKALEIVVSDPSNGETIASIAAECGMQLRLAVAERSDIVSAIDELYPLADQVPALFLDDKQDARTDGKP